MHQGARSGVALLAAGLGLVCASGVGTTGAATARAMHVASEARIPNVRVSHSDATSYGQPALAVNARNPSNLLGVAWTARDTEETFVSFDGGRTWHDNGPLPLPDGVIFGGDPSAAFDAHGTGFVACLGESQSGDGVYVWRSDDGGRSFHRAVPVVQGQPADHPWLAVDPTHGHRGGDLYVAWATRDVAGLGYAGGLAFSRSTDGGRGFAAPRIISAPARGVSIPVVAAGAHGAVSVAYITLKHAPPQGTATPNSGVHPDATTEVQVVNSTDYGRSFGRPVVIGPATSLLEAGPGFNLSSQPSLAIDPHDGSVYIAYSAYRTAGSSQGDVVLARSRDGGRTWSLPLPVTAGLAGSQSIVFQPHVVVDDLGGVDITFFALAHGRVNLMLARSVTRGASVGLLRRVTDTSFDPSLGWHTQKTGTWWIGDYQGLAAGGRLIHPFWGDTRTGQLEIFTAAIPTTM